MATEPQLDPEERLDVLFQHLGTRPDGLGSREAARRLRQYGPNEIRRREQRSRLRDLAHQFTHPLALLLWAAAVLAWVAAIVPVAIAIVVLIVVNALFAFAQELQAERAVEALAAYLPSQARVIRDGGERRIDTRELVPGDVLLIEEGDRVSADARLLSGAVELDMSTLTGESEPVDRTAELADTGVPLL
ncbi:MAG: HAD-IC family P-type ATPase, partial [Solirubrobacterales bacterium]